MLCLPNPTQQLLLKAVLNPDLTEGYQQFLNWQHTTDFKGMLLKSEIRLLPMIWYKYKAQLANNPYKDRLGGLYKKSLYNNSRLFHQLAPIVEVLDRGQFTYAFTKGIALHYYVYNDLGSRPMNDIDILIAPNDFKPALDTLLQLGYYFRYPNLSIDTYVQGELHACTLNHNTYKGVDLHYYPAPYHTQQVTNDMFLEDTQMHLFRGIPLRLLSPQKLALFLILNYQLIDEWHWIADFVFLHQKYSLSVSDLRPITQVTGLCHVTHQQLLYLSTLGNFDFSDELNFYASQPMTLTNRWLLDSKKLRDARWRLGVLTNASGLSTQQKLSIPFLVAIIRWYYRSLRRTEPREFIGKTTRFFRDITNRS
ncbi:nucleotidyltransferase family protein [Spirosoma gilvum]